VTRVVLALGSNLGDRVASLQSVVDRLAESSGVSVLAVSSVYESEPVGGPDQPDYLNAVVVVDTSLAPEGLLAVTKGIEAALGRVRAERWGPRTIDIDIVDYAGAVSDDPSLTLPHPRALDRGFVVVPWSEVDDRPLPAVDASGVRRRADLALQVPA
jgi:2-amino-4-hydroxy-6-hydroxymethyldihydropteridine diphosphokinase